MKTIFSKLFIIALCMTVIVSCGKDETESPSNPNTSLNGESNGNNGDNNGGKNNDENTDAPVVKDIVVTVDDEGKADSGHHFTKIDDTSFYIDDIKYSAQQGDLVVTGYNQAFFNGAANIIYTLKYEGRTMSVVQINDEAFKDCPVLTSVLIPNSVMSIGAVAFYGCSGLTSLTIGNSVTNIGDNAFRGCSGLTSVTVESGNTVYDSRDNCNAIIRTLDNTLIQGCKNTTISNSVTSIGDGAFYGCKELITINIPSSIIRIGTEAFLGCSGLTSLTLPNSVSNIGFSSFESCTGLTAISLGEGTTSIGDKAFASCSCLKDVYCYAVAPPQCYSSQPSYRDYVFYDTPILGIRLHVPPSSFIAYSLADQWKQFGYIVAMTDEELARWQ